MPRNILLSFERELWVAGIIVLSSLSLTSRSASANEKGWILTQRSQTLGDQYVYLSPSGLKCVNPQEGLGLMIRAPNWIVVLFNDKTKLYYQTTIDKWKRDLAQRGINTQDVSMNGWVRKQTKSIAGLKATQYVSKADDLSIQRMMAKRGKRGTSIKSAEYWVSEDIAVPPKLANMLQAAYGLPSTHSVPLRLSYVNRDGNSQLLLETYRAQTTSIPQGYFNLAAVYRPARTEAEVIINAETRQMINDLASELGTKSDNEKTTSSTAPTSHPLSNADLRGIAPLSSGLKVSKDDINKFIEMYRKRNNK